MWRRQAWEWPEDETAACWWIANYADEDKNKEVKLICRSLACMRMELHQSRLATTAKLRAEWDRRLERNAAAVDVLNSNRGLWLSANGIDPESLRTPSESAMEHCHRTAELLNKMLDRHGPSGGLDSHVQDLGELRIIGILLSTMNALCHFFAWLFCHRTLRLP